MSNLVTLMIPHRGDTDKLFRCIRSIHDSATALDYEVLVWLDDDDKASLGKIDELRQIVRTRVFVGPPLGYDLLDRGYFTLLAYHAASMWVWIFNSDMVLSGDWMSELRQVEPIKIFCEPEIHKLGTSVYLNDPRTGSPIFLNGCWKEFGHHTIPAKADYILTALLEQNGWRCQFLKGVTVWHDHK